jgi:hypothetical protein
MKEIVLLFSSQFDFCETSAASQRFMQLEGNTQIHPLSFQQN